MRQRLPWLLMVALLGGSEVRAQEALVLSAGGSRGLAHVGVLIALDSLRHDPDLVVGVSMGAVVGSLYAAGYTPDEILDIAVQQDWRELFKPLPLVLGPRRAVHLPTLHWAAQLGRFEFSRGFMPDWRTNRTLVHLLFEAGARARGNFDRLPRRYRALAAESVSGEPVVLARGDLARAVRASMAESGLFSPVRWQDRVLIDGGVFDYLPVALARAEGGAPVIAADVLRNEKPIGRDPLSMIRQAITLLVTRARRDTTPPDFLIVPDLDPRQAGFSYPDDVLPLVQLGRTATLRVVPRATTAPVARAGAATPEALTRLAIATGDSSLARLARSAFRDVVPGTYSTRDILRVVDRLYASGFTESVWPYVDSAATLHVHIDPRPNTTFDVAPAYDNDRGGRIWAAIQRRVANLGAPTELEFAAALTGTESWVHTSVRRALPRLAPLAWTATAFWQEADARFVRSADTSFTQEITRFGGALGLEHRHIFPDYIISLALHGDRITQGDSVHGSSFGPAFRLSVPEADRMVGVPLMIEAEQRFGDYAYGRAALRGSLRSDRHRLKLAVVADAAITDRDAPADVLPALGDDRAMPGLRWGEQRGRARLLAGFDVAYPVALGGHIRVRARAGAAPLRLQDFEDADEWLLGTELAGVWTLPFASLLIGGGFTNRGHQRFDLVVGSVF